MGIIRKGTVRLFGNIAKVLKDSRLLSVNIKTQNKKIYLNK